MRKLRFLLPVLMLGLCLWIIPALCPKPPAESLEEYYGRLYPRQICVGPDLDAVVYDYARLKEEAKAILVVTPEETLTGAAGSGYSQDKSYAGTNPRLKYNFYNVKSIRRVKVLRVLKGEAEPGDSVWVLERCALVDWDRLLVRQYESWPMVKGCVYLLFLDGKPLSDPAEGVITAKTIGWDNGWFDLTHLSLNNSRFLNVLTAALTGNGLLTEDCREKDTLSTPWTEKGYELPFLQHRGE